MDRPVESGARTPGVKVSLERNPVFVLWEFTMIQTKNAVSGDYREFVSKAHPWSVINMYLRFKSMKTWFRGNKPVPIIIILKSQIFIITATYPGNGFNTSLPILMPMQYFNWINGILNFFCELFKSFLPKSNIIHVLPVTIPLYFSH